MFLLLPYTHESLNFKRLPWITLAIIVLNTLIYMITISSGVPEKQLEDAYVKFLRYYAAHPYLETPKGMEEFIRGDIKTELDKLKEQTEEMYVPDVQLNEEQQTLDSLAQTLLDGLHDNVSYRFGTRPSYPVWWSFITSQFLHAGFLHLLGNMLFLYLAGTSMEDLWGRPLYLCFYLSAGILAAVGHDLRYPDSDTPLVGASGAIAGLMGAFLVRLYKTRISFFYMVLIFIRGTFKSPAWVVLPLWLLQQYWMATLLEESSSVAFWAHIGGFAFGAAFAVVLDLLRFEDRYIRPYIDSQVGLVQNPNFLKGMDLAQKQDYVHASNLLRQVVQQEPDHVEAHMELRRIALETGNEEAYQQHTAALIETLIRKKEKTLAFDLYYQYFAATHTTRKPLPTRTMLTLGAYLEDVPDYRHAVEIYNQLLEWYPNELPALKAYGKLARIYIDRFDDRKTGTELLLQGYMRSKTNDEWRQIMESHLKRYGIPIPAGVPAPHPPPLPLRAPAIRNPEPAVRPTLAAVVEYEEEAAKPAFTTLPDETFDGGGEGWKTVPCWIEELSGTGIRLKNDQSQTAILEWKNLQFVSVGRIRKQDAGAAKPEWDFLLIDLLTPLNGNQYVVYRVASQRFTFPKIFPGEKITPNDAYRKMMTMILASSHAHSIPDREKCLGPTFLMFSDPGQYQAHLTRQVPVAVAKT